MGRSWRTWLALGLFMVVAMGCGRQPKAPVWSATVQVQGNSATISVEYPGQQMGKDYHPHLFLDGGAEVMMFAPTYTFRDLTPGNHQVRVTISNPAHRDMPDMTRTLQFVVT